MANNFKNSFVSVSSAGEYYQSTATDSLTGPQTVYTANNGSGVNSILIELDAANTGDTAITATVPHSTNFVKPLYVFLKSFSLIFNLDEL